MAKSAEQIREELRTRKGQAEIATMLENGQHDAPSPSQQDERVPPERKPKRGATVRGDDTHRALPHSEDAEKGVLCAILQRPAAVLPIAQQVIGPDHFYQPQHRIIYDAMCSFEGNFDLVTLTAHLDDMRHLDSVGGPPYLTRLQLFGAIPENAAQYIEILNDKYGARRLIKLADEIGRRAYEVGEAAVGGPADIFDELWVGLEQVRAGLRSNLRLPELRDASMFLGENLPPAPPELVKGVVNQGNKIVVGGTSKGRKTMTLIDLAVSVATGTPWWGFETAQGPVCYINFEIQESFMWKRINDVCTAKDVTLPRDQLMVWNLRGHGEGIENLFADLMAVLRYRKFVLIIIDPIYKALGDRDENKAGDVASMLNQLEKIAVKTGAAVAFGAHYSKGNQALKEPIDRIGGSGVFARDPDSILTMTAHEEPEAFTIEATLRNFAPIEPFVVRWEWPLFRRADELDPHALKQPRGPKEKHSPDLLLDQLSVVQGAKPKELIKYLDEQHGVSRKTVYRMKDRLEAKKLMVAKEGYWWRAGGA
jgi:Replicative DNA helicase